ncbi:hypothetical protein Tco_1564544 [Tanacetum coccineum]
MQRPPLFESDGFIYWKNRFETYVKSKDLDIWHVITYGDFHPIQYNPETKKDETISFDKQNDDLKKKLAKNNEAKMVIYNALPRKEYEGIFMCKTANEIWDTLLITHQGNSQVKDNKIDLLVQQYEQFTIPEEESIDNAFARFNTIITSLKVDEGFSSKNYVRKFLSEPNNHLYFIFGYKKNSKKNDKNFRERLERESREKMRWLIYLHKIQMRPTPSPHLERGIYTQWGPAILGFNGPGICLGSGSGLQMGLNPKLVQD